jgi:hypothetical protein
MNDDNRFLNEEDELKIKDAVLPQLSLEGNSPRAMPNFANKQSDEVVFMNNLFKDTPAFDPRVQPQYPDQLDMEDMLIESEVPKIEQLKSLLQKKQQLSPNRQPASEAQPLQPKIQAEPETDNLLLGQGMSKILQGIARTQGGQIDDNADFYNRYRQYMADKPQRELENKIKQRNFDRMTKMDDPNSQESINFKKALEKMSPDLKGVYGSDWDKISANDKDTIFDIIRTRENIEGRKDAMRLARMNRDESLEEKKRQFDERMMDKKEQQQKLSEKQVKDLTAFDEGISLLDNISATKDKFDTGPVSSRQNALAQMFGMDDAQKSAFKADVQSNVANYIKSISGAAVSENERKYLLQNMPNMTDNDATFAAKLKTVRDRLERNRNVFLTNVKKSGKNTKEFEPQNQPIDNSKKDAKIENYAQQHNLDYSKAEQILRARGYK